MILKCLWRCFECCKRIPILFVVCIVIWSYYVYLFHHCYNCLGSVTTIAFQFIPYHILLFLFFWSFLKTAYTPIQRPPDKFFTAGQRLMQSEDLRDSRQQLLQSSKHLPILCRNFTGAIRFCNVCQCFKPDRCHHCSVCGMCVLKMDHHCPWVNNCVGFMNYKFFLLFLWYGLAYCAFISASLYDTSMLLLGEHGVRTTLSIHLLFLWLLSSLFAIGLLILSSMHLYLVLVNKTTLELFQATTFLTGPRKKGFHLGLVANLVQVFGSKLSLWPFPVQSSTGDGVTFRVNAEYASEVKDAMQSRLLSMAEEGVIQA